LEPGVNFSRMIELNLNRPAPEICNGASGQAPSKLLQNSWRLVLALGFLFSEVSDLVNKVVKDHPILWSLSIALGIVLSVAIDKVILWLYMEYAPSIFERELASSAPVL